MAHPHTRVMTRSRLSRGGVAAIALGLVLVLVGFLDVEHPRPAVAEPPPAPTDSSSTDSAADPDVIYEAFDTASVSPKRPLPVVTVRAQPEAVTGTVVSVTATISKTRASGEVLVLEHFRDEAWTAVDSVRVDDRGTAAHAVTAGEPGTHRYRLWLASTTQHQELTSDEFRIEVVTEPTDPAGSPDRAALETTAPEDATRAAPPQPLCGDQKLTKVNGTPWVCTYDDEFDGAALDRRYWIAQRSADSGFVTGSPSKPACVIDDARTIAVADGLLTLRALVLDKPITCGTTTSDQVSGMVMQHGTFSQTYGRWEVRARVPSWAGKGLQETFWLWPNDHLKYGYPHPASGEIDFAEFYSAYSKLVVPYLHYLLDPRTVNATTKTNIFTAHNCAIRVGEFNTYGLEWTPGLLRILVNGSVCITNYYYATNAPDDSPYAPFDQRFFLALTQAFGTTGNEFDPATGPKESATEVDYVRIWH